MHRAPVAPREGRRRLDRRPPHEVVGRENELAAVESFLDGVVNGPSTGLIIGGEPGLGKTTIWEAGAASARQRSFTVLTARPAEPESRLSYAALADLMGGLSAELVATLPAPQSRALQVALLRAEPGDQPPDRRAVGTAVLGAVLALAKLSPVLIAVDDLQWLDPASMHALQFALRRIGTAPIGLLAAIRTDMTEPLGENFASAMPGAATLALTPLSLGALRHLLASRLGASFSHSILVRLRQASGGNPLFALEIGQSLQRDGGAVQAGDPLPLSKSLRDLLYMRLGKLSALAQRILLAASAVSQPTVALLAEIEAKSAVEDALREAVAARVVEVERDRIRFTHPLLASVVYMSFTESDRRVMHGRLARVVRDAEERARHLAVAAAEIDEETAAACEDGARSAASRGAPYSAAQLALSAIQLTPALDEDATLRRSLEAARYLYQAGDTQNARALLRTRVASLGPGPARASALYQLAVVEGELGPARESVRIFEQALAEADRESAVSIRIAIDLAWMLLWGGDAIAGAERARQALDSARALGQVDETEQALFAMTYLNCMCGQPARDDIMRRAVELAPSMTQVPLDRSPMALYGLQLMRWGRLEPARSLLEQVHSIATERGDETSLSAASFYLAQLECMAGRWPAAAAHVERGLELAALTGVNSQEIRFVDAMLRAHFGRVDEALMLAQEGLVIARDAMEPLAASRFLATIGFLHLSTGHNSAAGTALGEAWDVSWSIGIRDPGAYRFAPDLVEACVATRSIASTGSTINAEEATSWLEERARVLDHPWAAAAGARCRGLLRAVAADPEGAAVLLGDAIDRYTTLGMPFDAGRTALSLGQLLRRQKRKRAARENLQMALGVFEGLGAVVWADRARSELSRIGGRASTPYDLTPSERQVAHLVASGHRNREVAEALYMTVNTVETNLSRIYRKLGVRSRSELAATLKT